VFGVKGVGVFELKGVDPFGFTAVGLCNNFNIRLHADPLKFLQSKNPAWIFHSEDIAKTSKY